MSLIGALFNRGIDLRQRSIRHFKAWFNRELAAFARRLTQDLAERYPPELETAPFPISPDRVDAVLREASGKVAKFNQEQRLSASGKADLDYLVRLELKRLGYSEHFIEHTTEALVVVDAGPPL